MIGLHLGVWLHGVLPDLDPHFARVATSNARSAHRSRRLLLQLVYSRGSIDKALWLLIALVYVFLPAKLVED